MLTTKRRTTALSYYKGHITESKGARILGLTREKFRGIHILFAKEELNRLWNSKT